MSFAMPDNLLRIATLLVLAFVTACRANYREWQSPGCTVDKPDLVLLQISDTHVRNAADAAWVRGQLQKALAMHGAARIVLTGDITAHGTADEWQAVQSALAGVAGTVYIWGNHDMPLKGLVAENPGQTHWEDIGDYRLIYLDTAWPGPFVGSYTSVPTEELEKLRRAADTEKKILVFGHHPMSDDAPHFVLKNAADVRAIFKTRRLVGVFTGHFHGGYVLENDRVVYAGVAPFSSHQMNHTFSQRKGYRVIELSKDCLRTTHQLIE